jgi:hypothetical protein
VHEFIILDMVIPRLLVNTTLGNVSATRCEADVEERLVILHGMMTEHHYVIAAVTLWAQ